MRAEGRADQDQDGLQLVLICGGRGTRFGRSATESSKSMLEVAGEPLVGRLIGSLAGLHRSAAPPVVLVAAGVPAVSDFLKARWPEAAIVSQTAPDGVANAILLIAPHLRSRALVVLGDLLLDGRLHEPFPPPPAIGIWPEAPPETLRQNFGVRLDSNGRVVGVFEKPSETDGLVCGIGVYLLTREQIESFAGCPIDPSSGERQITAAIEHLRSRGATIGTIRFEGTYINVNSVSDLQLAERHLRRALPPPL